MEKPLISGQHEIFSLRFRIVLSNLKVRKIYRLHNGRLTGDVTRNAIQSNKADRKKVNPFRSISLSLHDNLLRVLTFYGRFPHRRWYSLNLDDLSENVNDRRTDTQSL